MLLTGFKRRCERLRARGERGSILILVVLSALVIIGSAGLAVDVGRLYASKAELSRAVDAAALAGVLEFNGQGSGLTAAQTKALAYMNLNEPTATSYISANGGNSTLTIQANTLPGTSLPKSDEIGRRVEQILLAQPEVVATARRTGRAEYDEHVQGVEAAEIDVGLRETGRARAALLADLRRGFSTLPGTNVTIGQPISHRIDHMLSGTRANIAVKIVGDDLPTLRRLGEGVRAVMTAVPGAVDVSLEQQMDVPFVRFVLNRPAIARYGLRPDDVAEAVETSFAGTAVGRVFDRATAFDLVVKFDPASQADFTRLGDLPIDTPNGGPVPVRVLADVRREMGPNMILRENVQRRIVISANVAGRDLGSVVEDMRAAVAQEVPMPPGYRGEYGGQFESEQSASRRLLLLGVGVVAALFMLLVLVFGRPRDALLIMINLPLARAVVMKYVCRRVEPGRRHLDGDRPSAGVLPEPAVDARERRRETAVGAAARLLVEGLGCVGGRAVLVPVKVVHEVAIGAPGEEHRGALGEVVLVLHVLVGTEHELPRVVLVFTGIERDRSLLNRGERVAFGRHYGSRDGLRQRREPERPARPDRVHAVLRGKHGGKQDERRCRERDATRHGERPRGRQVLQPRDTLWLLRLHARLLGHEGPIFDRLTLERPLYVSSDVGRADGRAYRRYIVGTTTMFRRVDVINPHRITMAIGVWISLPAFPPPNASGISASPAAIAVIRIGMSRSRAPRSTASRKSVTPSSLIRC